MSAGRKAACVLVCIFLLGASRLVAQIQGVSDSLRIIYQQDTAQGEVKLELLRNLAFNEVNDLNLALQYAEELLDHAQQLDNATYLGHGYFQRGNKKRLQGDLNEAMNSFFRSAEVANKVKLTSLEGSSYAAIADIYAISNNFSNAVLYYNKAISILRTSNDAIALASSIMNAGDALLNNQQYDSALVYFDESGAIFEQMNYLVGKAYNLGNIGMVYANKGQNEIAEKNINAAISILEESGDYYPISVYLLAMSDIYFKRGNDQTALDYAVRSLQLAQQYGLKDQISEASLKLSQLYEQAGNTSESLKYYKEYIAFRDSVNNIRSVQAMADLRTDYEVSQKQSEVDLLAQQRQNQRNVLVFLILILALAAVLLGTLFWYYRNIRREKKRSESLLLNILPAKTAEELKLKGKVDAVKFDEVTVLFTDFVQFTRIAEEVEPVQLVKSIDHYFRGFDEITTKYDLEKIKTIGDSYMCACGLPTANPTHAKNAILAAREMIELVNNRPQTSSGLSHFQVRIGVHTGPVVAGIVGIKKWQYDIWGDTVNIASRMESKSEPGRVNLSETTYRAIKNDFTCMYRGEMEIKNHKSIKMYFLV
ncbi:MAG: tetratricopeptide repeat protein [Saprospiraceae bacterium]|nr:tetratricopeptide repeat protein [Saprospiraceae bacterium]